MTFSTRWKPISYRQKFDEVMKLPETAPKRLDAIDLRVIREIWERSYHGTRMLALDEMRAARVERLWALYCQRSHTSPPAP